VRPYTYIASLPLILPHFGGVCQGVGGRVCEKIAPAAWFGALLAGLNRVRVRFPRPEFGCSRTLIVEQFQGWRTATLVESRAVMDGTDVDGNRRGQWQKALILGFFVLPIVLTLVVMLSPPFRQLREHHRQLNQQLLTAVEQGDKAQVERLLRAGAAVNASTPSGLTALTLAIMRGHDEIALLLIARGASLDARDRTGYLREMNPGNSPAYYAAVYGRTRVLKALLARGVSPNQRDRNGRTLLMLAAENGHRDTVRMLLTAGADPNARSVSGETVLEAAQRSHDPEIIALIQQGNSR
jgi:hypothetical protein